jgi:1-aminocyclopropane-1-carboxylate deaminase/D-cysteine desulfhydrase-like pyridoxal-dependent ACC family enzyme
MILKYDDFDYSLHFPITINQYDGIYVLRDDLLPGGTKRRSIESFVKQTNFKEYIYPGTSRGAAIVALGYAVAKYRKKGVVFIAERKTPNELMQEALDAGEGYLEYKYIPMGFYPKIKKACERYCKDDDLKIYIKSGNDTPFAVNHIAQVAAEVGKHKGPFDVVLAACSSGTLIRGIQRSGIADRYVGVATGQKGINPGPLAEVIAHNELQKFEANPPKDLRPPYPTVLNYDGKVWQYALVEKKKNPNARILVWNVWATADQRRLFQTDSTYNQSMDLFRAI